MAGEKIMVCDDEPHIIHVVSTKLKNGGFEVITAIDGEEALKVLKEHVPALVITDYQMPFLSGLELCAKMRADVKLRQIPVIMLTARGFSIEPDDIANTSIQKMLPKPFSPRELLKCVKEILASESASVGHGT